MNPAVVTLQSGHLPLLVSIPHAGECLPERFSCQMSPAARKIADTDWHLPRLYAFALEMGASVLQANYSRYIIDVNRPPDGSSLYPGQGGTGLCALETFRGESLYTETAGVPDAAEIALRIRDYWEPYHAALRTEIARMRGHHPHILVWEAHSIAGVLPRLFEGRLPDLNIGTFDGVACATQLRDAAIAAASASPFTWSVDARFKGGFITRHYGKPEEGVHAVQLEMAQHLYMSEQEPYAYQEERAAMLLPTLKAMVQDSLAALQQVH
ncbi:N-formylglutamate deformylase [Variovorax defluvii]|uniref:N-formylglutamate deformylase n=1 Tax=Variovorax defluvii TaxID=913761 RepID=A0ABP8H5P4_9BURK